MDYYLKASSEQSLWAALLSVGAAKEVHIKNEQGEVINTTFVPAEGYNIDIIGTIYRPTGNLIQHPVSGVGLVFESPEMVPLEGFHANLRGPADLAEKVEVIPYQPTEEELADINFVMPEPTINVIPSPLADLLVNPKNPVRVWL